MKTSKAVEDFIEYKKVYCAAKTVEVYSEHLGYFVPYAPENLEELTKKTIYNYVISMREDGVRSVTINTYMRSVKVFCRWLYEEGYLEEYVCENIKLPRPDPKIKKPLSMTEVKVIDRVIDGRDKFIFHLLLDAGLRESEVCNLKKSDVDLEHNLIFIRNSKFNRNRVVPLCQKLRYMAMYYCRQDNGSEYLIVNKYGEQLTPNLVKMLFVKIKKKSGVSRVHAHLCRHTFATSYIVGGGNLEKLRIMLGHTDYDTTKVYLHLAAQFEIVRYPIYQLDPVFFERGY